MNELDPESKRFIKWCLKKLKDKLVSGAKEHGKIDYSRDYDKEVEMEILDIFGWYMMKQWVKEHDNKVKKVS